MKERIAEIPNLPQPIAFATFDTGLAGHHEICKQYNIRGLPFLAFHRDGLPVRTTVSLLSKETLIRHLNELIAEPA